MAIVSLRHCIQLAFFLAALAQSVRGSETLTSETTSSTVTKSPRSSTHSSSMASSQPSLGATSNMTIMQIIDEQPFLSNLSALLHQNNSEVMQALQSGQNVTFFAPSNEAFAKLNSSQDASGLNMSAVLLYHLVNHTADLGLQQSVASGIHYLLARMYGFAERPRLFSFSRKLNYTVLESSLRSNVSMGNETQAGDGIMGNETQAGDGMMGNETQAGDGIMGNRTGGGSQSNDTAPYLAILANQTCGCTELLHGNMTAANIVQGANATNGMIYLIDTVLIPPKNLSQALQDRNLSSALESVRSQTNGTLTNLTLFVPEELSEQGQGSSGNSSIAVVKGVYYPMNLTALNGTNDVSGRPLNVSEPSEGSGAFAVNSSKIVDMDGLFDYGMIYRIKNSSASASLSSSSESSSTTLTTSV